MVLLVSYWGYCRMKAAGRIDTAYSYWYVTVRIAESYWYVTVRIAESYWYVTVQIATPNLIMSPDVDAQVLQHDQIKNDNA